MSGVNAPGRLCVGVQWLLIVVLVGGLCLAAPSAVSGQSTLIFGDEFDSLNMTRWKHEITMGGGGNWEFEMYHNNRSNSYVNNSVLYIQPTFTADVIGEANLKGNSFTMDLWGSDPASQCTGNAFYGCSRTAGAGGNYLNPIQSARVRTAESFSFKYGRVDISAQLPKGDWIWPAMWLLPRHEAYGTWPASGEIDIMESRGNAPGYPGGGYDTFASTLHWGPYFPEDPYTKTHAAYTDPTSSLADKFHTYTLLWNETTMQTQLDGKVVLSVDIQQSFFNFGGWDPATTNNPWAGGGKNAPFDQEFYLIFNVAVGGTNGYFPDGQGGKPWSDTDPHAVNNFWDNKAQWGPTWTPGDSALKIDYVRVYQ